MKAVYKKPTFVRREVLSSVVAAVSPAVNGNGNGLELNGAE